MKASETTVLSLLQGAKVFLVPNFQRRYSWRAKEWELLWADLVRESDVKHSSDAQQLEGHFLGSVVLHPAGGAASVLMQHLVIDGQQRLTTILVLLAALRDVRAELEPSWDPKEYDYKYLTNPYDADHPDRLVPTELDRHAYSETLRRAIPTEGIGQAYTFFEKKVREFARSSSKSLEHLGNTLLLHMLLVEINTGTGDSVNNIFNTLNSKGRPLTSADLVRNELLLHVGEERSREAYETLWTPMEKTLVVEKGSGFDDREFVSFLWSREVAFDPKATRQDLFPFFERRLRQSLDRVPRSERSDKAYEIFRNIFDDHRLFLLLRNPSAGDEMGPTIDEPLRFALDRLRRWGSEPSTPLALWLLREAVLESISQSEAAEAIDVLLGYLGRRALAGVPTNLLNRILTPIAFRLQNRRGASVVSALSDLLSAQGSYWPSDSEVLRVVANQPVFVSAKRQIKFLLTEAERVLSGTSAAHIGEFTVQHVMPQSLAAGWEDELLAGGEDLDDARAVLHTLGNLTLAEPGWPRETESFDESRQLFHESSLRINQRLSSERSFLPVDIEARSKQLATLLLTTLPGPSPRLNVASDTPESTASAKDRLETALQTMADGEWTTEAELVEFLGIDANELRALINQISPVVARLIRDSDGGIPEWFSPELHEAVRRQITPVERLGRVSSDRLGDLVRDLEQTESDAGLPEDEETS